MANKYHSDIQTDLSQVDFGSVAEADFNAQVALALNTAIPASNGASSVNDILLDKLTPRLPTTGTLSSKPILEFSNWRPLNRYSGDLEAATKTITATTEASGTVNADYSFATTQPAPPDARWASLRIASRIAVTIDSDDGTHDLRCRVYVDAQAANSMLYDLTFSTIGAQVAVQDTLVGTKEVIFNLLKDGAAHTMYFFFWTPGNHAPVISYVNINWGTGTTAASGWGFEVVTFNDTGLIKFMGNAQRGAGGTGTCGYCIMFPSGLSGDGYRIANQVYASQFIYVDTAIGKVGFRITDTTVATDFWSVYDISALIVRF